jgi:hypothetical protein
VKSVHTHHTSRRFQHGFDSVNLHRPTNAVHALRINGAAEGGRGDCLRLAAREEAAAVV